MLKRLVLLAVFSAPLPALAATLATGDPATTLGIKPVAIGLDQPTDIAPLRDGRLVVTLRLGDVAVVPPTGDPVIAGHIAVSPLFGEQGLLGVIADPDFATNHVLYFYASSGTAIEDKHKVYKTTLGDDNVLSTTLNPIIDKGLLGPLNHDGGGLVIHKGKLYVGVGDTGHNATPPTNHLGTCLNSPNGKILRINLDGTIPQDNPLVGLTEVTGCSAWNQPLAMMAPDTRVYAWGFRNPWRFWIDPKTDLFWIGDVGETTREEISVGPGAKHYGWPFAEGTVKYTTTQQPWQPATACEGITPASECIPPQYDYPHTGGNNCVVGGMILDGCGWPAPWTSRYIFGDNGSGSLWTLDVKPDRTGTVAGSVKDFGKASGPASFRMGEDGALYIVEVVGGAVQRVLPKAPTLSCGTAAIPDGGVPDALPDAGPDLPRVGDTAVPPDARLPDTRPAGTPEVPRATGGTPSDGGGPATGGTIATGGSIAAGGSPAAGGVVATAGAPGTGGVAPTGGTQTPSSSGCGCHLGGRRDLGHSPWLILVSLVPILHSRRRRVRTSPSDHENP